MRRRSDFVDYSLMRRGLGIAMLPELHQTLLEVVTREDFGGGKVGVTSDPEARSGEYKAANYDRMYVLLESTEDVRKLDADLVEQDLIDFAREHLLNIRHGGDGPAGGTPYYVYVCIGSTNPALWDTKKIIDAVVPKRRRRG